MKYFNKGSDLEHTVNGLNSLHGTCPAHYIHGNLST